MKVVLGANDTVISKAELERLRRIEVAHDAYLAASRIMGGKQADRLRQLHIDPMDDWTRGWLQCLSSFNEAVVSAPDAR